MSRRKSIQFEQPNSRSAASFKSQDSIDSVGSNKSEDSVKDTQSGGRVKGSRSYDSAVSHVSNRSGVSTGSGAARSAQSRQSIDPKAGTSRHSFKSMGSRVSEGSDKRSMASAATSKVSSSSDSSDSYESIDDFMFTKFQHAEILSNRTKKSENGMAIYNMYYTHPACTYMMGCAIALYWFTVGWYKCSKLEVLVNKDDTITRLLGVGSKLLSGYMCNWISQKYVLYISSSLFILVGTCHAFHFHVFGYLVFNIAYGLGATASFVFAAECSPPALRDFIMGSVFLGISLGELCIQSTWVLFRDLHVSHYQQMLPSCISYWAVIQLILLFPLPRSPVLLIMTEDNIEAEESVMAYRRVPFVTHRLAMILTQVSSQPWTYTFNRFLRIVRTPHMRKLMMITSTMVILRTASMSDQMTQKLHLFLEENDSSITKENNKLLMAAIIALCSVVSLFVFAHVGTRKCLIVNYILTAWAFILALGDRSLADLHSTTASPHFSNHDDCSKILDCLACINSVVNNNKCGFCFKRVNNTIPIETFCTLFDETEIDHCKKPNYEFTSSRCPDFKYMEMYTSGMFFHMFSSAVANWATSIFYVTVVAPAGLRSVATSYIFVLAEDVSTFVFSFLPSGKTTIIYYLHVPLLFFLVIFIYLFVMETHGRPLEYCDILYWPKNAQRKEANRRNSKDSAAGSFGLPQKKSAKKKKK